MTSNRCLVCYMFCGRAFFP